MTSSPLYPQANGKAEKGVQIVKRLLKKAAHSGTDPHLALMAYRAAPLERGRSPAELLMGRNIRTRLMSYNTHKPKDALWADKAKKLQQRQKWYYDRSAIALLPLDKNDEVRIEGPGSWNRTATVLQQVAPRSYNVVTEDGDVYRRNRRHLLKLHSHPQEKQERPEAKRQEDSEENVAMDTENVTEDTGMSQPTTGEPQLRRSQRNRRPVVRMDL